MLNPADAPIWLLLGYFEVLDFSLFLNHKDSRQSPKGMSRLGGVLLNCKRRRVILCAVVASGASRKLGSDVPEPVGCIQLGQERSRVERK